MKIGLVGNGAIAMYAQQQLERKGHRIVAILVRTERVSAQSELLIDSVNRLPEDLDVMIDCAGHSALSAYGPSLLGQGVDLITVSLGALADDELYAKLLMSAREGGSRLHLASGAIGALDCLHAASVGQIHRVQYIGRKPPRGWLGSAAEKHLDLSALPEGEHQHFAGTAREASLIYPKNANVAAAVALAGVGFDNTRVQLIADTRIQSNVHEIVASGEFGEFHFKISGNTLPDNPRTSALAAMSVVSKIEQLSAEVVL